MNISPPMISKTFSDIQDNVITIVYKSHRSKYEKCCWWAEIWEKDEIINTAISTDGSWQRPGFSSLNGLVTVIVHTLPDIIGNRGKTKNCYACKLWKGKKGEIRSHQNQLRRDGRHCRLRQKKNPVMPVVLIRRSSSFFWTTFPGNLDMTWTVVVKCSVSWCYHFESWLQNLRSPFWIWFKNSCKGHQSNVLNYLGKVKIADFSCVFFTSIPPYVSKNWVIRVWLGRFIEGFVGTCCPLMLTCRPISHSILLLPCIFCMLKEKWAFRKLLLIFRFRS